jgi:hypothetical protein
MYGIAKVPRVHLVSKVNVYDFLHRTRMQPVYPDTTIKRAGGGQSSFLFFYTRIVFNCVSGYESHKKAPTVPANGAKSVAIACYPFICCTNE